MDIVIIVKQMKGILCFLGVLLDIIKTQPLKSTQLLLVRHESPNVFRNACQTKSQERAHNQNYIKFDHCFAII